MTHLLLARSMAALGATAALFVTSPALAQQTPGEVTAKLPPASQTTTRSFSDEDLESYVKAEAALVDISERYEREYGNETDVEKLTRVRQEMNEEMVEAVSESGIEIETFNEIARALRIDPDLSEKVARMR